MQMPDMCDSVGPWVEMVFLKQRQNQGQSCVTPPQTTCYTHDPRRGRIYEPVISDMKLNKGGNARLLFLLKKKEKKRSVFQKIGATSSGRYVNIFNIPKNKLTHRRRKMAANFTNASALPRSAALSLLVE